MEADEPLVRIRGLTRLHAPRGRGRAVQALAGIDLDIRRGTAVALVGRSGSGKSTLARCLARLEDPTGGEIRFDGADVSSLRGPALRAFRERVQLVLQDSVAALDPRFSAVDIVSEPLEILGRGTAGERRRRALELMATVGLSADQGGRRPGQLSGGQRQRLALARALAVQPRLLILDEAFAGLDASVQAQIAALLEDLRERHDLTYLHVSHDLALMASMADEVAVIHEGRIVESGPAGTLFAAPQHAETRALIDAVAPVPTLTGAGASRDPLVAQDT
jgi:ABC-type glutathione transport system ATPase component